MNSQPTTAPVNPANTRWYVFLQAQAYGPYSRQQVAALVIGRKLGRETLVCREDWGEWRKLGLCLSDLADDEGSRRGRQERTSERRIASPRTPFLADVKITRQGADLSCRAKDISVTGIFLLIPQPLFQIGEILELTIQSGDLTETTHTTAEVARFCSSPVVGYGLRFTRIDNRALGDIARLIGPRPISEFGVLYTSPPMSAAAPVAGAAAEKK